jgi:hypothetical protein
LVGYTAVNIVLGFGGILSAEENVPGSISRLIVTTYTGGVIIAALALHPHWR